jgi:hypothetical protein
VSGLPIKWRAMLPVSSKGIPRGGYSTLTI